MSTLVLSSNEIDAMAKKAAKGAGMPWGLAAEAGRATRWLADRGLPGPEQLADLLDWRDGRSHAEVSPPDVSLAWGDHPATLDPIVVGSVCADLPARLAEGPVELGRVRQPMLLGFGLAVAGRRAGVPLSAHWAGTSLAIAGGRARLFGDPPAGEGIVAVSVVMAPGGALARPAAGWTVDPDAWARLEAYAHRTYAPDTEESRLRGAGAGLIDD